MAWQLDRRQFLELSGAALATAALGCDGDGGGPCVVTAHDVSATEAIIHGHCAGARAGQLTLEPVAGGSAIDATLVVDAAAGATGWTVVRDLVPATVYRYRVDFDDGSSSDWQRLVTAPAADAEADVRFAIVADIDTDPEFDSEIFAALGAAEADFVLSLGDWPYADNAPGAQTLAEYHQRHRLARIDPRLAPALATMSLQAIYDDHEVRNDWDARFRDELEPDRVAAGVAAWDRWFPLRSALAGGPRYRSLRLGRHAELFILDTRLYRSSAVEPDGPGKTMLGAEQLSWLIDSVTASTARYVLIASTVPLDFNTTEDSWSAYARERDQMLAALQSARTDPIVFLAGDAHWFAVHHFTSGIVEYQVGPLARGLRDPGPEQPEELVRAKVYNFGELAITGGTLTFTARDQTGAELYSETL